MPKKPPRDNPSIRNRNAVQSAATLLQRISQKSGIAVTTPQEARSQLEHLRAQLPETLRPHLVDIIQKPDELVCFMDSAVWAARLRLVAAELPELTAGRKLTLRIRP